MTADNVRLVSREKAGDQALILGTMGSAHAAAYETILALYDTQYALLRLIKEALEYSHDDDGQEHPWVGDVIGGVARLGLDFTEPDAQKEGE